MQPPRGAPGIRGSPANLGLRGIGHPVNVRPLGMTNLPLAPQSATPPGSTTRSSPHTPPESPLSRIISSRPTPYSRPENTSSPGDSILEICRELLQDVRRGREENRKMSEDIKKMGQMIVRLEDNYKKMRDDNKDQSEAAFSVETSVYKVWYTIKTYYITY